MWVIEMVKQTSNKGVSGSVGINDFFCRHGRHWVLCHLAIYNFKTESILRAVLCKMRSLAFNHENGIMALSDNSNP
jgi:hypothetical protein